MHRATSDDDYTQAWFDYSWTSIFPQSLREKVKTSSFSTYQLTNAASFSTIWYLSTGRVNSGNQRSWISPITKGETTNIAELSLLEFEGNNYAHVILTSGADSLSTNTRQLLEDCGMVGCHSARSNDLSVHPQNWFHRICSPSLGIYRRSKGVFLCSVFSSENWLEIRKTTRRFARANSWYAFLCPWNCCISHWRQRPQHHWGQFCANCKMYSGHQEKAAGDQIKSSETTMLCVPSPSWASNEGTSSCSTKFRISSQEGTTLHGWC